MTKMVLINIVLIEFVIKDEAFCICEYIERRKAN